MDTIFFIIWAPEPYLFQTMNVLYNKKRLAWHNIMISFTILSLAFTKLIIKTCVINQQPRYYFLF